MSHDPKSISEIKSRPA